MRTNQQEYLQSLANRRYSRKEDNVDDSVDELRNMANERVVPDLMMSVNSGGSSVSQNKLPQLILGYTYILKYLQSNFIG